MQALKSTLRTLVPHAGDQPLRFLSQVVDFTTGLSVYGVARLLADVFERYDSPHEIPSRIICQLQDQALNTVLLSLANTHSNEILGSSEPCSTPSVKLAVDLVDLETRATYSVSDLARQAGVSVRALELGFRKTMNLTPHAYLHRTRMEKAHKELAAADPRDGKTVTEIAQHWGFSHTGRFAARYCERYGVMPSQTLRSQ
jgi:AraC-like DNA-binding protein